VTEILTVGIFYEPLIVITCFREGVVIAVDAKWWSLLVELGHTGHTGYNM